MFVYVCSIIVVSLLAFAVLIAFIYFIIMLAGANREAKNYRLKVAELDGQLDDYAKLGYVVSRLHSGMEDWHYDIRTFTVLHGLKDGERKLDDTKEGYYQDIKSYVENYGNNVNVKQKRCVLSIRQYGEEIGIIYIKKGAPVLKTNYNYNCAIEENGKMDPVILPITTNEALDKAKEDLKMLLD